MTQKSALTYLKYSNNCYLVVSINGGTPSHHPFQWNKPSIWDTPISGNPHLLLIPHAEPHVLHRLRSGFGDLAEQLLPGLPQAESSWGLKF